MTLPGELQEDVARRLPGRREESATEPPVPAARPAPRSPRRDLSRQRVVALAKRTAKRAALAVWRRTADADGRLGDLQRRVDDLTGRQVETVVTATQTEANRVNLELLKAEVRALQAELEELGMAFAPATGLAGAGKRFAEQREQVNVVERRIRLLDRTVLELRRSLTAAAGGPAGSRDAAGAGVPAAGRQPHGAGAEPARRDGSAPASASFNYVGFERRFRGDPAEVLRAQSERYTDLLLTGLPPAAPVVDLGCGRGELLEDLQRRGATVLGVDTDGGMVAEAAERGIPVERTDAVSFLRRAAPGSLGAVFSAHVAEHLELEDLLELVSLSASRLRPGGLFVAETPNPESLVVLGNSYVLDPTHVRPLHPSLFSFLCESAGFRDVRLRFFSPAQAYHLPLIAEEDSVPGAGTVNEAFRRLNHVLFGPQEYAVVARTAGEESGGASDGP